MFGSSRSRSEPQRKKPCRRGFIEIPLYPAGCQTKQQRWPDIFDTSTNSQTSFEAIPNLYEWRNNLTACSQRHNLYFIAYGSVIKIYQPNAHDQTLNETSALTLPLPFSGRGLPPGVFRNDPHSVNVVLVDEIGDDEAVLCACDDGDVIGYWTEAIWGHMNRVDLADATASTDGVVRPFFHVNVGESAWGLATHKQHRLIAVSSNDHTAKVFSPALQGDQYPAPDNEICRSAKDSYVTVDSASSILKDRSHNYAKVLEGHDTNIPTLAFAKGVSSKSVVLITADIGGKVVVWDVESGAALRVLIRPSDRNESYGHDRRYAGWGVIAVDRYAFNIAENLVQAAGCFTTLEHQKRHILDLTLNRFLVNESGDFRPSKAAANARQRQRNLESSSMSAPPNPADQDESGEEPDDDLDEEDIDMFGAGIEDPLSHRAQAQRVLLQNVSGEHSKRLIKLAQMRLLEESAEPQNLLLYNLWPTITPQDPTKRYKVLGDPFIFLQPQTINLFPSPDPMELNAFAEHNSAVLQPGGAGHFPIMQDPLFQAAEGNLENIFARYDRLNLYTQIPELGVVLVGSPKGRVAVLTLHQLGQYPENLAKEVPSLSRQQHLKPFYTMRLDHILPLQSQEQMNQRPLSQLVGVAAGPIFGPHHEEMLSHGRQPKTMRDRPSRWRIMMMYRDHTLLTYELTRPRYTDELELL